MLEGGIIRTECYYSEPWGWKIIFLCILLFSLFFYNNQPSKPLPTITHILVEKSRHKMTVYHGENYLKEYTIALGSQPIGPKQNQGDGKTPEGNYRIIAKNERSKFHLSLKISYPNENDVKQAVSRNIAPGNNIMIHGLDKGNRQVNFLLATKLQESKKTIGNYGFLIGYFCICFKILKQYCFLKINLMVPGKGFGWIGKVHTLVNWTRGCIAVTNPEIEEIYAATSIGTPVEIRP